MPPATGRLITLVAYDEDGLPRPVLVDADGNLQCVNMAAAGGGALKTPSGKLFTPVANDPDDLPRPFLVDEDGYIKVAISNLPSGGAWTLIEDQLLTASTRTINFSDIPATYKQLKIEYIVRTTGADYSYYLGCRLNDLSTNIYYSYVTYHKYNSIWNDQESRAASSFIFGRVNGGVAPAGYAGGGEICFANSYAGEFWKLAHGISREFRLESSTWHYLRNFGVQVKTKAAINKISIYPPAGIDMVAGSRLTLYGIK